MQKSFSVFCTSFHCTFQGLSDRLKLDGGVHSCKHWAQNFNGLLWGGRRHYHNFLPLQMCIHDNKEHVAKERSSEIHMDPLPWCVRPYPGQLDMSGMIYPSFQCPCQVHSTRNSCEQSLSSLKFQGEIRARTSGLVIVGFLGWWLLSPHQATTFNANFGLPGVVRLECFVNLVRPSLLYKHRDLAEDLVPSSSLLDVLKGDRKSLDLRSNSFRRPYCVAMAWIWTTRHQNVVSQWC